jgi:hypothetical protein
VTRRDSPDGLQKLLFHNLVLDKSMHSDGQQAGQILPQPRVSDHQEF